MATTHTYRRDNRSRALIQTSKDALTRHQQQHSRKKTGMEKKLDAIIILLESNSRRIKQIEDFLNLSNKQ